MTRSSQDAETLDPELLGTELPDAQLRDAQLGKALDASVHAAFSILHRGAAVMARQPVLCEVGRVSSVGASHATVQGLPGVRSEELVRFGDGTLGMAFDLRPRELGVVLLDHSPALESGAQVWRTGRVLDVPVGEALLGRVVDAVGRPIDEAGPLVVTERWPVERPAPPIIHRAPVEEPLHTGLKVIDAMLPIGRGQRELIIGDRQTGKSAIAIDAIVHQPDDVICVYCAIGQRAAFVARVIADLSAHGALERTLVVVAGGAEVPGLQFVAPYAATTMAEYFRDRGRDVLIVYDDLTRHARAYRELSLLLRRPPGREAYPGDIFYVHSRLLERSTRLREAHGGGSLTALPIVETQAQNLSAYIATNLISITDGQIYVSSELFHQGILPAVDIGRSVSRVGGKAQRASLRSLAARLRLDYAQFEELEEFSRFETRLDRESREVLEHGRRVREILQQTQYSPVPLGEQIAVLLAVTEGIFRDVAVADVAAAEEDVRRHARQHHAVLLAALDAGEPLDASGRAALLATARKGLGAR